MDALNLLLIAVMLLSVPSAIGVQQGAVLRSSLHPLTNAISYRVDLLHSGCVPTTMRVVKFRQCLVHSINHFWRCIGQQVSPAHAAPAAYGDVALPDVILA